MQGTNKYAHTCPRTHAHTWTRELLEGPLSVNGRDSRDKPWFCNHRGPVPQRWRISTHRPASYMVGGCMDVWMDGFLNFLCVSIMFLMDRNVICTAIKFLHPFFWIWQTDSQTDRPSIRLSPTEYLKNLPCSRSSRTFGLVVQSHSRRWILTSLVQTQHGENLQSNKQHPPPNET